MTTAQLLALISSLWSAPCEATEPTKTGRVDIVCQGDVRAQLTPKGDVRVMLPSCRESGRVCKLAKVPDGFLDLLVKAPAKGKRQTRGSASNVELIPAMQGGAVTVDDGRIVIEYGVVRVSRGWLAAMRVNGKQTIDWGRARDRDIAASMAMRWAMDEKAHYLGDWDLAVVDGTASDWTDSRLDG